MHMSSRGLRLLREFEGCVLRAYKCPAGIWTIGYGSTGPHVKKNLVISKLEADALLIQDLERFEKGVIKAVAPAKPSQCEFDAMVSLAFNIGLESFSKSSVARQFKLGNKARAASAFGMWNKARVNGTLTVLPGLVRRRAAEKELFLAGAPRAAVSRAQDDHNTRRAMVPEESIQPEAPKSLAKSREVILGGGLGVGGITEFISKLSTDDLRETKEVAGDVQYNTQGTFLDQYYIPEVAALLCGVIGAFMIYKRFKDRKEGVR